MFFLSSDLRNANAFLKSIQLPNVSSVFNVILNTRLVCWHITREFQNH